MGAPAGPAASPRRGTQPAPTYCGKSGGLSLSNTNAPAPGADDGDLPTPVLPTPVREKGDTTPTSTGREGRDVNSLKGRSRAGRIPKVRRGSVPNTSSTGRISKTRNPSGSGLRPGGSRTSPSGSLRNIGVIASQVSAEVFNDLKKDLEDCKREKGILTDVVEEVRLKNSELQSKLDAMQVELRSAEKDLTEAQGKKKGLKVRKTRTSRRESYRAYGSMFMEENVPSEWVSVFQDCTDKASAIVQYVVRESSPIQFQSLYSPIGWFPNWRVFDMEECRDWRGRMTYIDGSNDSSEVGVAGGHSRGAAFFSTQDGTGGETIAFNGSVPFCIMEQAEKGEFFTASDTVIRRVVGQFVLKEASMGSFRLTAKMERDIYRFASTSPTLMGLVTSTSLQSGVGTRKSAARLVYFRNLGYNRIVAPCGKKESASVKTARGEEENSAASRLLKKFKPGVYDTSFWRKSLHQEVCHNGCPETTSTTSCSGDRLFGNEAARLAYRQWVGYEVSAEDDTSLMYLVRLDAWMTVLFCQMERRKEGESLRGGGHTTWMKREFRRMLPIAAEQLLGDITGIVRRGLLSTPGSSEAFEEELSICDGVQEAEILSNDKREMTLCFRYPRNKHYYVALLPEIFNDYVCPWLGKVKDCYIAHSADPGSFATPFLASEELSYVHDSDEEKQAPVDVFVEEIDLVLTDNGKKVVSDGDCDMAVSPSPPQTPNSREEEAGDVIGRSDGDE